MLSYIAAILFAAGFCGTGFGQQVAAPQSSPSTDANCSDPANASLSECATLPDSSRQQQGIPNQDRTSVTPQIPRTYSDNESLNRSNMAAGARNVLPPEPLTELQRFVASTTGQVLPIFGAELFRNVPSTFAPLDLTPVPSDYAIGPGDELRIRVWGQVSFEENLRVDRSGQVYLPHIGPVQVSGLPFSSLREHLRNAIGRQFRNFELSVDVGQIRAIQVYVTGQARRPGVYTVSSLSTLLDSVFASGGPSLQGSLRHIELLREGRLITDLDLYDLLTRGDKSRDVKLLSGDVIFIPPVGPEVALTGSVRNRSIYELRAGDTLNDVITAAGGLSALASDSHVTMQRVDSHREMRTIGVALDAAGLATPLAAGDVINISPIVARFNQTVTLRGNLANPGRFAWHAGMRISELIPEKESLLTRDYWWERARLGLPAPEFEPATENLRMRQPSHATTLPRGQQQAPTSQRSSSEQPATQSGASSTLAEQLRGQQSDREQPEPDRGSTCAEGDQSCLYSDRSDQQQQQYRTSGQVGQGTGRAQESNKPVRNEVKFPAPEIDWDYAAIERLDSDTLKTKLIPFDLGRLVLQHDASQDLELQPGDVVTIFSEADIRLPIAQQSKLIRLEGEFVHAGSYTTEPGETLRQLVRRAGGFTPNAYLYGSEFGRESTRAFQQARIDEYVRNLEIQTHRANLAVAAAAVSSSQDIESANAAQGSEREMLAQLRLVRATGRIVLEFTPGSSGIDAVPDIQLENGDTFIVPALPAHVNVVGAVYDQNSFLYQSSRLVGTYLHLAGGANRNADEKHEFIIRANGEVVSRDTMGSNPWGGNSFVKLAMNPGDTVVVPEKTFKPSVMRGVLEWSQLFSQFALGAAAISVIHP